MSLLYDVLKYYVYDKAWLIRYCLYTVANPGGGPGGLAPPPPRNA